MGLVVVECVEDGYVFEFGDVGYEGLCGFLDIVDFVEG